MSKQRVGKLFTRPHQIILTMERQCIQQAYEKLCKPNKLPQLSLRPVHQPSSCKMPLRHKQPQLQLRLTLIQLPPLHYPRPLPLLHLQQLPLPFHPYTPAMPHRPQPRRPLGHGQSLPPITPSCSGTCRRTLAHRLPTATVPGKSTTSFGLRRHPSQLVHPPSLLTHKPCRRSSTLLRTNKLRCPK